LLFVVIDEHGTLLFSLSLCIYINLQWCGAESEGLIALDEEHKAKAPTSRSQLTKSAAAIHELQQSLQSAILVYVSATGAKDVSTVGKFERLHLWGDRMPFKSARVFERTLKLGGEGTVELLAMGLKAQEMYVVRHVSFSGVDFAAQTLRLSLAQRKQYDAAAMLWGLLKTSVTMLSI
jgi:hypothetical protein